LDVSQSAEEELDIPARPTVELGNSPDETAELHWRFGLPLACIVGSLLALGVARVKPRQGRFAKAVPGMLLMLVYFLLLLVNRNALAEGNVPSNLGLWMVHGAFAAVAVVLLQRVARPVKA
jgi:lipopolysaccharide export system permease protein